MCLHRVRGGSRTIPGCSAYQVYYQSPDSVGPVCDHLLTRAQGHSALELPLITSFFGHLGAVLHGATTTEWFWIKYIYYIPLIDKPIIVHQL